MFVLSNFGLFVLVIFLNLVVSLWMIVALLFLVIRKYLKHLRGRARRLGNILGENFHDYSWINRNRADEFSKIIHKKHPSIAELSDIIVDVCVVLYNSEQHLENLLSSIERQKFPTTNIHLIFVDNNSSDGSVKFIKTFKTTFSEKFNDITLIQLPINVGFGQGHNEGFKHTKGQFFLVTNPDLEFEEDAILNAVSYAYTDDANKVASWELRQKPYEHPKIYDAITLKTFWSSAACLLINAKAFKSVGGFDEKIFLYGEDVELSYKFIANGWDIKYCPSAAVWHYTYKEAGIFKPEQFVGSIKANGLLKLRYGSYKACFASILQYPKLFLHRIVRNRTHPDPHFGLVLKLIIKAYWGYLKNAPSFLLSRKKTACSFPFNGFDYTLIRPGAFYEQKKTYLKKDYLVSVIIRTHGDQRFWLKESVTSVLNQTYRNIELILVEDGGNNAQSFVDELSTALPQMQVKYFPLEKVGRSAAGNCGLANASGDFLMFLDSDDYLFADHVEVLVNELVADMNIGVAYTLAWAIYMEPKNKRNLHEGYIELNHTLYDTLSQPYCYEKLQLENLLPIQAGLFRREVYEKCGGFDESLDLLEDWNLWLRFGYHFKFKLIEKLTSGFRLTRDPKESKKRAEEMRNSTYAMQRSYQKYVEREKSNHPIKMK